MYSEEERMPNGWWVVEVKCLMCGYSPTPRREHEEPVRDAIRIGHNQ